MIATNTLKLKTLFLLLLGTLTTSVLTAQQLKKITLTRDGMLEGFSFDLGEAVILQITKDGQIIKWGVDLYENAGRNDNFYGKQEPYTGKTGYYLATDDSAYRGKIKFIGRVYITWYASYENTLLQGKIKSIGNIPVTYYEQYEDAVYKGNIKTIGSQNITWYSSFENAALKGKIKSVGPTSINYFSSFDDKAFAGKIKSIGSATYSYYSSLERNDYRGSRKTGEQTVHMNGIKYYISW